MEIIYLFFSRNHPLLRLLRAVHEKTGTMSPCGNSETKMNLKVLNKQNTDHILKSLFAKSASERVWYMKI